MDGWGYEWREQGVYNAGGDERMIINPIKDKDGTDAVMISFSNQVECKLNNIQLDSLKDWLNKHWSEEGYYTEIEIKTITKSHSRCRR